MKYRGEICNSSSPKLHSCDQMSCLRSSSKSGRCFLFWHLCFLLVSHSILLIVNQWTGITICHFMSSFSTICTVYETFQFNRPDWRLQRCWDFKRLTNRNSMSKNCVGYCMQLFSRIISPLNSLTNGGSRLVFVPRIGLPGNMEHTRHPSTITRRRTSTYIESSYAQRLVQLDNDGKSRLIQQLKWSVAGFWRVNTICLKNPEVGVSHCQCHIEKKFIWYTHLSAQWSPHKLCCSTTPHNWSHSTSGAVVWLLVLRFPELQYRV